MTTPFPAPKCPKCETLPARAAELGTLHLWFPLGHTFSKVVPFLGEVESTYALTAEDRMVSIRLDPAGRDAVLAGLAARLGPEELRDTKALFIEGDREPALADYAQVTNLTQFLATQEANWLLDLLEANRFTSWFQPIVHAGDPTRIFGQEALFRGFDEAGGIVAPTRIFDVGRRAGLLFQLDLQARRSAIREAARHGLTTPIFINFNPASIYDPAFCLRSTTRAIDEAGIAHDRIVFEVVESEQVGSPERLAHILDYYRAMGFKVALDDLGSGYSSLNLVAALRPDFIKLDMALIRGVDHDPYKAVVTAKLLELAAHLGVKTIAEGVETQGELDWLRSRGASFVQGYLIAKPGSPPVTSLAPAVPVG